MLLKGKTMIATAVTTFGRLDVIVNNAGVETRTSILDTTEEQYERVLDTNLKSVFFGTQFADSHPSQGTRRTAEGRGSSRGTSGTALPE